MKTGHSHIALLLSLASALTMSGEEHYHVAPIELKAGTVMTDSVEAGAQQWSFHCRVELPKSSAGPCWEIVVKGDNGGQTGIKLERKGLKSADFDYEPALEITLSTDGAEKKLTIDRGIDPSLDGWSVVLERVLGADSIDCRVGQRMPLETFRIALPEGPVVLSLEAFTALGLSRMSLLSDHVLADRAPVRFETVEDIDAYLSESSDAVERKWCYLDRDTDQRVLNLGGDYKLATIKRQDGAYDLVYIEGARVNGVNWKPMMIKGRLKPTPFVNHFDLVWYDAYGREVDTDTSADIIDTSILKLNFPLQGGVVRFRSMP